MARVDSQTGTGPPRALYPRAERGRVRIGSQREVRLPSLVRGLVPSDAQRSGGNDAQVKNMFTCTYTDCLEWSVWFHIRPLHAGRFESGAKSDARLLPSTFQHRVDISCLCCRYQYQHGVALSRVGCVGRRNSQ